MGEVICGVGVGDEPVVNQAPGGERSSLEVSASAVAIDSVLAVLRLHEENPARLPLTVGLQLAHIRQYALPDLPEGRGGTR
jgi:hypothetical protein